MLAASTDWIVIGMLTVYVVSAWKLVMWAMRGKR